MFLCKVLVPLTAIASLVLAVPLPPRSGVCPSHCSHIPSTPDHAEDGQFTCRSAGNDFPGNLSVGLVQCCNDHSRYKSPSPDGIPVQITKRQDGSDCSCYGDIEVGNPDKTMKRREDSGCSCHSNDSESGSSNKIKQLRDDSDCSCYVNDSEDNHDTIKKRHRGPSCSCHGDGSEGDDAGKSQKRQDPDCPCDRDKDPNCLCDDDGDGDDFDDGNDVGDHGVDDDNGVDDGNDVDEDDDNDDSDDVSDGDGDDNGDHDEGDNDDDNDDDDDDDKDIGSKTFTARFENADTTFNNGGDDDLVNVPMTCEGVDLKQPRQFLGCILEFVQTFLSKLLGVDGTSDSISGTPSIPATSDLEPPVTDDTSKPSHTKPPKQQETQFYKFKTILASGNPPQALRRFEGLYMNRYHTGSGQKDLVVTRRSTMKGFIGAGGLLRFDYGVPGRFATFDLRPYTNDERWRIGTVNILGTASIIRFKVEDGLLYPARNSQAAFSKWLVCDLEHKDAPQVVWPISKENEIPGNCAHVMFAAEKV